MKVVLELTLPPSMTVDLRTLQLQAVLALSPREIGELVLEVAGRETSLAEFCRVTQQPDGTDELILTGSTRQVFYAGCQMTAGRLVIDGDAGPYTGAEMRGGVLEVLGNVGDCLGAAMHGGLLQVSGNAGDWCGAALVGKTRGMDGGTILIHGNTGAQLGACMRRGLINVSGDAGDYTGWRMLAGTVIVSGKAGPGAGLGMRRGSLVVGTLKGILPGFLPSGFADEEWLRIYFRHLERLGGGLLPDWTGSGLQRFYGDMLELGKGELLVHDIL